MNQNIRNLYFEFKNLTQSNLLEEHFERLVFYFPAILVVVSDGVVDKQEWTYVKYLAKFIAETFIGDESDPRHSELIEEYSKALKFMVENASNWENKLLTVLKENLELAPEVKEDIYDSLFLFAEASDGASEEEKKKIESLSNFLSLR